MQCKYCDIPMYPRGDSVFECKSCMHTEDQLNKIDLTVMNYSNKGLIKGEEPKFIEPENFLDPRNKQCDIDNESELILGHENSSNNNGGKTDYYNIKKEWKIFQDVIEDRKMNYAQGNIFKVACTFNIGRHSGTTEERELNKIIFFAERELKRLRDQS